MSVLEIVTSELMSWPQPESTADGKAVVVPTHVLYPSRTLVRTYVECDGMSVRVSDCGGAFKEVCDAGAFQFDVLKLLRSHASEWDLKVSADGFLVSEKMPLANLAELVAWVAAASRDSADYLLSKMASRIKRSDFRIDLDKFLEGRFPTHLKRNKMVTGESNKIHKFDYFVSLNGSHGILIDAVLNDASSINSSVVSNLDVARTSREGLLQRIVYDDREDWKASDLSLVRVGATPIAFSKIESSLARALEMF